MKVKIDQLVKLKEDLSLGNLKKGDIAFLNKIDWYEPGGKFIGGEKHYGRGWFIFPSRPDLISYFSDNLGICLTFSKFESLEEKNEK